MYLLGLIFYIVGDEGYIPIMPELNPIKTILAHSIDYDGCFAPPPRYGLVTKKVWNDYHSTYLPKEVEVPLKPWSFASILKYNQNLTQYIKRQARSHENADSIVLVGSRRQCQSSDEYGKETNNNGSAFTQLSQYAKQLQLRFNPYLLVDSYYHKPAGTEFKRSKQFVHSHFFKTYFSRCFRTKKAPYDFKHYYNDPEKIHLIYAQAHTLAKEHPDEAIILHFYDDRIDIMDSLNQFYTPHKKALPHNVTLKVHHYNHDWHRGSVKLVTSIQGIGDIDTHLDDTLDKAVKIPHSFEEKDHSEPCTPQQFSVI